MIIKTNVVQQVLDYLKENIENGIWKIGDKIPSENQLTEILGVSRASARMAIQQLIGIGCLESIHGKGTFVISDQVALSNYNPTRIAAEDFKDISKVLEFRSILEGGTARLAAENATDEMIGKLADCLNNMKKSIGASGKFIDYDMKFHELLCEMSGNPLLEKSLSEVFQQKRLAHQHINDIFGYKDGIYYHNLLLRAISNRDGKKAERIMKEHMLKALAELPKIKG